MEWKISDGPNAVLIFDTDKADAGARVTGKLNSIQTVRAFAAAIVALVHSNRLTNDFAPDGMGMPGWLSSGYAGVDIFFVLSGFIICLVTDRKNQSAGNFLYKRACRILPFYWFFTIAWFAMATLAGKEVGARGLFLSLMVLPPLPSELVLGVGWSLEQEFLFYALVAVLIAVKKLRYLAILLTVLFGLGAIFHIATPGIWDYRLLSLYNFQFLLGVLLYRYRDKITTVSPALLLGAGVLAFAFGSWRTDMLYLHHVPTLPVGWNGLFRVVTFGIAGFFMLAGMMAAERSRPTLFESHFGRFVVLIGNASFGWYLSHTLVFAVLGTLAAKAGFTAAYAWLAVMIGFTISAAFAVVWYLYVEKPFLAWVSSRRRPVVLGVREPS